MTSEKNKTEPKKNQKKQNDEYQNHKMTPYEQELFDFISNPENFQNDDQIKNADGQFTEEFSAKASQFYKSRVFYKGQNGEELMLRHGILHEKKENDWVPKHRNVKKVVFTAKDSDDEPTSEWSKKEKIIFK